jgi:hypothetical protein
MRALSATELLAIWERGLAHAPTQRALALLTLACPEESPEALAHLCIGRRDERLLTLREWMFGERFASLADCPSCGERLEINFNAADLRVDPVLDTSDNITLDLTDYSVRFRLPDTLDLAALELSDVSAGAHRQLLARCLLSARRGEREISAAELPETVVMAVAEKMAQADPQADLQLTLSCPRCRHQWRAAFDIVSFLWTEIHVWALRMLRDVHELAAAYGWRESDILALSPRRRQAYLEMIRA